jgi:hypothetical protein
MTQAFDINEIDGGHTCDIDPLDICDECLAIEFEEIWERNCIETEGEG